MAVRSLVSIARKLVPLSVAETKSESGCCRRRALGIAEEPFQTFSSFGNRIGAAGELGKEGCWSVIFQPTYTEVSK